MRSLLIGRRAAVALLAAVVAAATAAGCGPQGSTRARLFSVSSFGPFAGYLWRGPVSSVGASWTVPALLSGSPLGDAGTWIGAQGEQSFIQVGTNETRGSLGSARFDDYWAFWSDSARGFHPKRLFTVRAGDEMAATLVLDHGRWNLSISDLTSGQGTRFSTTEDTRGRFSLAQWLQEDITEGLRPRPHLFPYPLLAPLRFRALAVNSAAPKVSLMYSQWMSERHVLLAPSPVRDDAFTLGKGAVSSAGTRYLRIAQRMDAAELTYLTALAGWTPATSRSQIATASVAMAGALTAAQRELATYAWPPRIRPLISEIGDRLRALLALTRAGSANTGSRLGSWKLSLEQAGQALGLAAHATRGALGIPQLGTLAPRAG
jgi:hypothetical protein